MVASIVTSMQVNNAQQKEKEPPSSVRCKKIAFFVIRMIQVDHFGLHRESNARTIDIEIIINKASSSVRRRNRHLRTDDRE